MSNPIIIKQAIKNFNKKICISPDKSLSIRFVILASMANGKSKAFNLSNGEDVKSTIKCLKKLGVSIKFNKKQCEIIGNGLKGYIYKKNLTLDAGNSGTAARLLTSALINSPKIIKITGDKSLKKRDMKRIINPLKQFGAKFYKNKGTLPLSIKGSNSIKPIHYKELRGSAQCKSAVMIAALSAPGITKLKCLPSRNHTEILYKNVLKIPLKIKKTKKFDYLEVKGIKKFKSFNYKIPGDISSAAFPIVLTLLAKKSKMVIKNVNINPTRTGLISILNLMGASIKFKNKRLYKGEKLADIHVKSAKILKGINCPIKFNTAAIDEFLLIFLVAARANNSSKFIKIHELNAKESRRLEWGFKILKMIGIKTKKIGNHGIKIFGKPDIRLNKNFVVKNFLKDHRIFMTCVIAAMTFGGYWKIYNPESIKTSFPEFLKIVKQIGGKIN